MYSIYKKLLSDYMIIKATQLGCKNPIIKYDNQVPYIFGGKPWACELFPYVHRYKPLIAMLNLFNIDEYISLDVL